MAKKKPRKKKAKTKTIKENHESKEASVGRIPEGNSNHLCSSSRVLEEARLPFLIREMPCDIELQSSLAPVSPHAPRLPLISL